jgi:hypothetical protein
MKHLPRRIASACLAFSLALFAFALPPVLAGSVNVDVDSSISGTYRGANDLGTPTIAIDRRAPATFTTGTGDRQSDLLFSDERTIAASGNENLDLAGVLADPFGTTLTFVEVTAIWVEADCANTNNVVLGAATSPALLGFGGTTPTWAVQPCGRFVVTAPKAGWTITASSADLLKVANSGSGTEVKYRIIVVGRSQ